MYVSCVQRPADAAPEREIARWGKTSGSNPGIDPTRRAETLSVEEFRAAGERSMSGGFLVSSSPLTKSNRPGRRLRRSRSAVTIARTRAIGPVEIVN